MRVRALGDHWQAFCCSFTWCCSRPLRVCVVAFVSLPSPPKATSDDGERAKNIGRLTAAYTVGAALGPALGGYLGWELSAQFAIVGSFLSAVLVLAFPLQPAVSALRAARCRLCCAACVRRAGRWAPPMSLTGPPLLAAPSVAARNVGCVCDPCEESATEVVHALT